ncbi:autotransporter outer membrane beta-barrel domain-containing protein [Serratia microhaemolytica]|uniref:autotransporter outer membrane beta-barrel domain-containing protein n=1 Tax=Serratia microhaemolytica TaxID=2675110 RepID=UPI0013922BB7|nr:autotransporter outer membrane beta-barrel domain-containing protein [Serratia microhaemolytica]
MGSYIKGDMHGIYSKHEGYSAGSHILSNGTIIGHRGDGIHFDSKATMYSGTSRIDVNDVFGQHRGIYLDQLQGKAVINSSGRVEGVTGAGIEANNKGLSLSINANNVGGRHGILAQNSGKESLSITAEGEVVGTHYEGINAKNSGTDLIINGLEVRGHTDGIFAENNGTGKLSISSNGEISGESGYGVYAKNNGTSLDINVESVAGALDGIFAEQSNSGALTINNANTFGERGAGIRAVNRLYSKATDITINTKYVHGYVHGIHVTNGGIGNTRIYNSGLVLADSHTGIYASQRAGDELTIDVNNVYGYKVGIQAIKQGRGDVNIDTRGTVTGQSGVGIIVHYPSAGSNVRVRVHSGSVVEGKEAAMQLRGVGGVGPQLDIINDGVIQNITRNSADTAIDSRGNTFVNNSGYLLGTLSLGGGKQNVNNNLGAVWDTSGGTNNFNVDSSITCNCGLVTNSGTIITANRAVSSAQTTTFNNVGTFINGGTLTMANGRAGDTTIINGNYIGVNGFLIFDTALADDRSRTDKLLINGDISGNSTVVVNNAGGSGAQTLNGIELIRVSGRSNAQLISGRIAGGAYDYFLVSGDGRNGRRVGSWYLTSSRIRTAFRNLSAPVPDDAGYPGAPAPDSAGAGYPYAPDAPAQDGTGYVNTLEHDDPNAVQTQRPEATVYASNLAAANSLLTSRVGDRLGDTAYLNPLSAEGSVSSMWLRTEAGQNRSRDQSGQINSEADRYLLQLGGNLVQWQQQGVGQFNLGVMAGYAHSKSRSDSDISGYRADGKVEGYGVGLYATWYAQHSDHLGWYLDSWAQYNRFDNTVSGQGLAEEKYKSKGVTAALEGGYTFKVAENGAKSVVGFVQPQAQLTWQAVRADQHIEANGTLVSGDGDGNLQSRLGVKAFLQLHTGVEKEKARAFRPFVEANWLHNSKSFGSVMNSVRVTQDGADNIAELKLGVDGQLNRQWDLSGHLTQQVGQARYSDTSAQISLKYHF